MTFDPCLGRLGVDPLLSHFWVALDHFNCFGVLFPLFSANLFLLFCGGGRIFRFRAGGPKTSSRRAGS